MCRLHADLAAQRVRKGEIRGIGIEDVGSDADDVEVVAIEVDGVRDGDEVAEDGLEDPEGPLKIGQESEFRWARKEGRWERLIVLACGTSIKFRSGEYKVPP
jgi:hypothetical protein